MNRFEDFDIRPPVTTPGFEEMFPNEKMENEWAFLTEAIKQEITTREEVRSKLVQFSSEPVTEELPIRAIQEIVEVSPRLAALFSRYERGIGEYLRIAPVPDDQIRPDIANAPALARVEDLHESYGRIYDIGSDGHGQRMMDANRSGRFRTGITKEERRLVAKRYGFARDIKILALGAELYQNRKSIGAASGDLFLPSGIRVVFDQQMENANDFLSPHRWGKRTQFKDRVYEISAGESRFILKERKTARHTDTKRHGHKPSRTSSEEFSIGRQLHLNSETEEGDIKLSFERPIGFASYPDGFQFAVFGFEEGLQSSSSVRTKLERAILAHRDQFEEEWRRIQASMQNLRRMRFLPQCTTEKLKYGLESFRIRMISLSKIFRELKL